MNTEQRAKTLLVIDDAPAFCERITITGEDKGWTVFASADLHAIRDWLSRYQPDIVLLDWQLQGERKHYLDLLTGRELASRTLLLSNVLDEKRLAYVETHGLAGARLKPLDMARFEEAVAVPPSTATNTPKAPFNLEASVNGLPPAVDILDANLIPLWKNEKARQEGLNAEQSLIVRWLCAELDDKQQEAARRLDWDGGKEVFLESRLFRLSDGRFWLARDWRSREDHPHDHELLNLEGQPTRDAWLQAVAKLLAQRYAISRFRVYKVAPLPHTEATEAAHSPLIIPLFQSGGGFRPDEETWWNTGFQAKDNPNTQIAFQPDYEPEPLHVVDEAGGKHARIGCGAIGYGPEGTHRVLFPVRDREGKGILALFSFDRRLDHAAALKGFDHEVVAIAQRMAGDARELDGKQWSLMRGLAEDLGRRLEKWLRDGEETRQRRWHKAISTALKDTFADADRSPEMTYDGLSMVCNKLTQAWENPKISGHVMGNTPCPPTARGSPISSWHIALKTDPDHWQAVAGFGAIYDSCRRYGGHVLTAPHAHAMGNPWSAVVIQEYPAWRQSVQKCCRCEHDERCQGTGSWLAVPMMVAGSVRAMMVVHSPHSFYFTAFRVELLESAAERLLPLLAAALREVRARSAFAAAVMHEVKNDAHSALMVLDTVQRGAKGEDWAASLAEIRHHLEGVELLGQDTLEIFRLGLSEHGRTRQGEDPEITSAVEDLIKSAVGGWDILYEDTKVTLNIPSGLAKRRFKVRRALSLKRVLRVLLHNAFRHGFDWVRVEVGLSGDTTDETWLRLTVINAAFGDVAAALADKVDLVTQGLGASPLVRGRLGLAVARQLALDAGGSIGELNLSASEDEETEARVTLNWPVSLLDQPSEIAP